MSNVIHLTFGVISTREIGWQRICMSCCVLIYLLLEFIMLFFSPQMQIGFQSDASYLKSVMAIPSSVMLNYPFLYFLIHKVLV